MPQAIPPPRALLCIERPEEMGRLNIEPTVIHVVGLSEGPNDNPEATLLGGQNLCFKVHGRVGKIEVRFSYPFIGPGQNPREWATSFPVKIRARDNSSELFNGPNQSNDNPNWLETGWRYMRKFEPASTSCRARPRWSHCPDPRGWRTDDPSWRAPSARAWIAPIVSSPPCTRAGFC